MNEILMKEALAQAITQLGVKEFPKNSNSGIKVSEYQRAAGIFEPVAWCACFVYYNIKKACEKLGMKNPIDYDGQKGYTPDYVKWAKKNGEIVNGWSKIKLGMLYFMWIKSKNRIGHVGFIRGKGLIPNQIYTIEGNTDEKGSPTGGQVMFRTRMIGKNDVIVSYGKTNVTVVKEPIVEVKEQVVMSVEYKAGLEILRKVREIYGLGKEAGFSKEEWDALREFRYSGKLENIKLE